MHRTHWRNRPRDTHSRSAPVGGRLRRRSLVTLTLTGAVVLGGAGVVAARGSDASRSTGSSGARSSGTTIAPIVARSGLPDVPWLAEQGDGRWIYGRGERGAVRRLPIEETGLAIDDRFVATALAGGDRHSIVRFRDATSGRTTLDVTAPIWVSAAAWTPRGLVVTGYGDASATTDGGLLVVSPDDGTVRELVAGGPFSAALGWPVARGGVEVSASGATVASNACGVERCDLQVVDLATGVVTRPVTGGEGFLRAVTDDTIVTTDGYGRWISGRSIADGHEAWRQPDRVLIDPIALRDGSVVGLVGSRRSGWAISALDADGAMRDVMPRVAGTAPPPRIWRTVSSRDALVIGAVAFEEALDRGRSASVTVLTPSRWRASNATVILPAATEDVP